MENQRKITYGKKAGPSVLWFELLVTVGATQEKGLNGHSVVRGSRDTVVTSRF